MNKRMRAALLEYAEVILAQGWEAGEALIEKYAEQYSDFRKWANAVALMLRAEERLNELRGKE